MNVIGGECTRQDQWHFHTNRLCKRAIDGWHKGKVECTLETIFLETPSAANCSQKDKPKVSTEDVTRKFLVKWKGPAEKDTTWVNEDVLRSQFPFFSLEDQAVADGEGSDRALSNRPELVGKYRRATQWKVYTRRNKSGVKGRKGKISW